jgi:hydrogenase-4 membrane subunit HyfE
MDQVVQVLGSLFILAAFFAAQRSWLDTTSRAYLWLNLVGAAILAVLAAREEQYGFLLLETCWALVAAHSLLQGVRGGHDVR